MTQIRQIHVLQFTTKNYTISLYKQQHVSLHSLETAKMENLFQWLKGQLAPCKRGITAIAASAH